MATAIEKEKFRDSLAAGIDKYVKQQGRNTIALNAEKDSACAGYARVPGPDACDFCVTMGAANDFYHTEDTAGGGAGHGTQDDAYHPYCNCSIVVVFKQRGKLVARDTETGLVMPYDGKELVERYNEIGRPTYKSRRSSVRSSKHGMKLPAAQYDEAMTRLASAQSVDELHKVGEEIVANWPKNKAGRDAVQFSKMSKFAKDREKELAAIGGGGGKPPKPSARKTGGGSDDWRKRKAAAEAREKPIDKKLNEGWAAFQSNKAEAVYDSAVRTVILEQFAGFESLVEVETGAHVIAKEITTARLLVQRGHHVRFRAPIYGYKKKNPDFFLDKTYVADFKRIESENPNKVFNHIKHAVVEQKAECVVVDLSFESISVEDAVYMARRTIDNPLIDVKQVVIVYGEKMEIILP